jgi:hypothetical protein
LLASNPASQQDNGDTKMTEAAKTLTDSTRENLEKQAEETNKGRSGKGTRVKVGSTRGKNPQPISFEQFDESQPDTLPTSLQEFIGLAMANVADKDKEPTILSYLIEGYNADSYRQASDPIAEYIDSAWPEDLQKQFRMVVRNYSAGANVSLEDAVTLIRPGIVAAYEKGKAQPATV